MDMHLFMFDLDTYISIIELAKQNGKKEGENIQEEFDIILNKDPSKFTYLGKSDQDIDLITGNLRERGLKILNLNELERRKQNG